MFRRILIAHRGEIAVRIARTCRALGVEAVAVHSDVDAGARHVAAATRAVHLPGVAPTETYLNVEAILEAARSTGAEAIHPGYGFLSESASFADAVVGAGVVWVGPPPAAIRAVGDKISARRLAVEAGVPVVPGITDPVEDVAVLEQFASEHGYPVAIKASGGGGGRGLKVAHSAAELEPAWTSARREAEAYFGSHDVFVERYLEGPKHLEVQLLAPGPDEALWLGVRDCSLQRRHQTLIEETPPPRWAERVPEMGEAAVALSKACGYVNAGTVEMLVDRAGEFHFLEVNARLQVEHTVTEEVLGLDLVECQLRIASGERLDFSQADLVPRGHAIECRINAEDPARGFAPTPGRLVRYVEPAGPGVRVDSGYVEGDEVPGAYDSLIAKLVTHGADRDEARERMLRALDEYTVEGIETTIAAHVLLLQEESFVAGTHDTTTVEFGDVLDALAASEEELRDVLLVGGKPVRLWNPAMAASAAAATHGAVAGGDVVSPMQGTILKVLVSVGDEVEAGQPLVVLEAMKMENEIASPAAGVVEAVDAVVGETAGAGAVLVRVGSNGRTEPEPSP
ncbi:MAG TPA: biotin carboxylase N-terminal domain-containing protein [Actinomycetota bacterium]|nr:biotin carboxylase N-terminal domain-containing protein [Actinomycetota bacterium]